MSFKVICGLRICGVKVKRKLKKLKKVLAFLNKLLYDLIAVSDVQHCDSEI